MKKFLFCVGFLTLLHFAFAQNYRISQNTYQKVAASFSAGELSVDEISIPEGTFSLISLPGYGSSYVPGSPQLPQLAKMLQIPVCDSVVVTVIRADYQEYDAAALGVTHPVFPVQISAAKNLPTPQFAYDQTVYSTDAFYSLPLVRVEKAGVKRDAVLANLYVSPVQYNPVSNRIRIYSDIQVEFTFVNANMAQTFELQKFSNPFFSLNKDLVINKMQNAREEYHGSPIKYLIVANSMFSDNEDLAAFVAWKRRIGYLVEVAYTNDANVGSTTTSIKNFIQQKYDAATEADPAPTFLLFIGDHAQLPAFNNQTNEDHITDLYYATLVGNDFIPDCYYGRLSATNNQQLSNQIEKILMYEQYTMPDPSYLGNAVLIAGTDPNFGPTHANGQVNYIYNNYINLNNPRYSNVMVHLYNCSSQAAQIRNEVSNGVGWANYTAHGSETSWADPEFNVSHVYQLQNTDKYGLLIGNCCVSGHFNTPECFGEALLRAEKKGAMGYIGASNNSYWGEDFYWAVGVRNNINANPIYMSGALGMYDKLFHTHDEDFSVWASTIGGLMTAGNLTVQSSNSGMKQYYWEIYHCFGDPSVRPYLGMPSEMAVEAGSVIPYGSPTYAVHAAPYAYVALTRNGTLLAATFTDVDGMATLTLPDPLDPGECELVAMGQNYIPYIQPVQVITLSGPYVVPISVNVAANTVFTEGSTVNIDLSLTNVGVSEAQQVYATFTPVEQLNMQVDSVYVGNIGVNGVVERNGAFSFVMPQSEDNVTLPFTLAVHWQDTTITRTVTVRVQLPKVVMTEYTASVNHAPAFSFSAGDQVTFSFNNVNMGHAAASSGSIDLTCNYSGVNVTSDMFSFSGLAPNATLQHSFNFSIADTVPSKSVVPFYYHIAYDNTHVVDTLYIMVGGDVETFESGDFSQYNWTMNNNPWVISSTGAFSGQYCARSAQQLSNNSTSSMTITFSTSNAGEFSYYRKVSSEAGYDKFSCKVDGAKVEELSGEEPWDIYSMPLNAGTHTVIFAYQKDYSQSDGSDCAWVDQVSFPCEGILVVEDITDSSSVGIDGHELVRAKVFPNPTSEWICIESENPVQQTVLFDLNGRAVRTLNFGGQTTCRMNMNDVPAGFYLLQVYFENGQSQNLKIIKR